MTEGEVIFCNASTVLAIICKLPLIFLVKDKWKLVSGMTASGAVRPLFYAMDIWQRTSTTHTHMVCYTIKTPPSLITPIFWGVSGSFPTEMCKRFLSQQRLDEQVLPDAENGDTGPVMPGNNYLVDIHVHGPLVPVLFTSVYQNTVVLLCQGSNFAMDRWT